MNREQEGEVLDLDEQVGSNPSSNSLMVSKVTQQSNGAPIPIFIYTIETLGLQQITQWFGYDVMATCDVVTKDKLNVIEQGREEPNSPP